MTDLSDINMEGITTNQGFEGLPNGEYLVRIEQSDRKLVTDKYDPETGEPDPGNGKNYYLQFLIKVYGGPNNNQTDFLRFNLWNIVQDTANRAKSDWLSLQNAIGGFYKTSEEYHGKFFILRRIPGVKDPKKIYNKFSQAPAGIIAPYANVPLGEKAAAPAQTHADKGAGGAAHPAHAGSHAHAPAQPAAASSPNSKPAWA